LNLSYLDQFNIKDTNYIKGVLNTDTLTKLTVMKDIVTENLNYLKEFGVKNLTNVIVNRPDILFRTNSKLKQNLTTLDQELLIYIFENSIDDLVNFNI